MSVVANSTAANAVFRSDGIQLYGLDAELELKMQGKRDQKYEKEIGNWIEQVSGEKLEFEDIAESLKSGIVLCRLLNAIQAGTVKNINLRPIALMQVENIQLYLKGCWNLGVPTSDLFVTSDLYQKKGIPQVLQNIVSLARVVQTLPGYKGPSFGAKLSAPAPVKKWETIETNQVVYTTDKQPAKPTQANICMECGSPKKHLAKICDKCGSDMSKQTSIDLAQILASLHDMKKELAQAQTKYQKAEDDNKKLLEQLKQTAAELAQKAKQSEKLGSSSSTSTEHPAKLSNTSSTKPSITVQIIEKSRANSNPPTVEKPLTSPDAASIKPKPPFAGKSEQDQGKLGNWKAKVEPVVKIEPQKPKEPEKVKVEAKLKEKAKVEPEKPNVEADKAKQALEKAKQDMEKARSDLEKEKGKYEQEKAKFEQDKARLEQEKTKLAQEKAKLVKDNDKLSQDYQALDKKYRDEAGKTKTLDEKAKILEKKLEVAGLASMNNMHKSNLNSRPQQMTAAARPKPTLEYLKKTYV